MEGNGRNIVLYLLRMPVRSTKLEQFPNTWTRRKYGRIRGNSVCLGTPGRGDLHARDGTHSGVVGARPRNRIRSVHAVSHADVRRENLCETALLLKQARLRVRQNSSSPKIVASKFSFFKVLVQGAELGRATKSLVRFRSLDGLLSINIIVKRKELWQQVKRSQVEP